MKVIVFSINSGLGKTNWNWLSMDIIHELEIFSILVSAIVGMHTQISLSVITGCVVNSNVCFSFIVVLVFIHLVHFWN